MTAAAVLARETAAVAADVNMPPLTHGPAPGEYERRRRHRREIGSLRDQSETMLGKAVDRLLARDRLHAKSASPSARLLIVKAAKYGRYAQGLGALTRQFGTPQRTLVRLSVELRNDKRWLDRPHRGQRGEGVNQYQITGELAVLLARECALIRRSSGASSQVIHGAISAEVAPPSRRGYGQPRQERSSSPPTPVISDGRQCPDDPLTPARRCAFCRKGVQHPAS